MTKPIQITVRKLNALSVAILLDGWWADTVHPNRLTQRIRQLIQLRKRGIL